MPVYPTILLEIVGGLALAVCFRARIAALALAGLSIVAGVLFHLIPASAAEGMMARMRMISVMKNLAIAGGLLMMVSMVSMVSMGAGAFAFDTRAGRGVPQSA